MKKLIVIIFILILFPLASSKIIFNAQPNPIYNFKDIINTNITIEKSSDYSGYLESYLVCGSESYIIFKKYIEIKKEQKTNFLISSLASLEDNCEITAKLGSEEAKTNTFKITRNINTAFEINNKFLLPLEKLIINGTAIKENSEKLKGTADIYIPEILNQTIDISDGSFLFEYEIPKNTPPKEYEITVNAKESDDSGAIFNSGESKKTFEVKSSPTSIRIESQDSIKPPNDLKFKLTLLNQAETKIKNETIIYKIFNPENNMPFQGTTISDKEISIPIKSNATRGGWKINAYYGNIFASKPLYLEENKQVKIEFLENPKPHLKITNVGNVDYNGVINAILKNDSANTTIPININLSMQKSYEHYFEIVGSYNLSLENQTYENVLFTGKAILIPPSINIKNGLISLLVLLLVGCLIYITIKFRKKQSKNSKPISDKKNILSKKSKGKNIYSVFFNSKDINKINTITKNYQLQLHKINEDLSFILFYSSLDTHSEIKLLKLAREVRNEFPNSTIVLHTEEFENKASSIKSALATKEITKKLTGIILTESFYNSLKEIRPVKLSNPIEVNVKDRVIRVFKV